MPDVEIHNLDEAWRVWTIMRAVDWKWTIREAAESPEPLTSDVMAIQFAYSRHKEQKPSP